MERLAVLWLLYAMPQRDRAAGTDTFAAERMRVALVSNASNRELAHATSERRLQIDRCNTTSRRAQTAKLTATEATPY